MGIDQRRITVKGDAAFDRASIIKDGSHERPREPETLPRKSDQSNRQKILFLASNPASTQPLQLDEEIREITQKSRASEYRDSIELVSHWAARPDDLLQEMNTHRPAVLHFSGHGNPEGGLMLLDSKRNAKVVRPEALRALFAAMGNCVRFVVLNACHSAAQASIIAEQVDCVVGMNAAGSDEVAILFAASFYRALAFGRSAQEALEQGRVAVLFEDLGEEDIPQLTTRNGVNPTTLYLVSPE